MNKEDGKRIDVVSTKIDYNCEFRKKVKGRIIREFSTRIIGKYP